MIRLLPLLLAMAACDGPAPAPTDTGAQEAPPVIVPTLATAAPARAAFLGTSGVSLRGAAGAGSAALDRLELNGEAVALDGEGGFDLALSPQPGLNILGLRVEDVDGERAVDGRAFIWGETHDPGASIPAAVRLLLGPDLLDDDSADLDDAATLTELVLLDPSLADAFVGEALETDWFDIYPSAFSVGDAEVDLVPETGQLVGRLGLIDARLDFDVDILGFDIPGTAWVERVDVVTELRLAASDGVMEATTGYNDVTLSGYTVTVDWFPDGYEDDLADWTWGYLEQSIEELVGPLLEELVVEYLSGLAVEETFGEEDPVTFGLALESAWVDYDGVFIVMNASARAASGRPLPTGAGSPVSDEGAPSWPIGAPPFAALADDDFVNALLFAFWETGALSPVTMTGDELTALTGAELVPPLGPVTSVTMDFQLPPVVARATEPDQDTDLAVGELRLAFAREDGALLDFSVNARTGALLDFDAAGSGEGDALTLILDDRPANVLVEVGVVEGDPALDPGDLAALIRLLIPPLVGEMAEFAPAFELPGLPLSEFMDFEALQGADLTLESPGVGVTDEGWVLITGRLAAE